MTLFILTFHFFAGPSFSCLAGEGAIWGSRAASRKGGAFWRRPLRGRGPLCVWGAMWAVSNIFLFMKLCFLYRKSWGVLGVRVILGVGAWGAGISWWWAFERGGAF